MGCSGSKNTKKVIIPKQEPQPPSGQQEEIPPKTTLHWKRGQIIGEGAYGKVYECLNIDTGEILAAKHVKLSGDPQKVISEVKNLKKEILTLRELKHKNIVRYITTEVNETSTAIDIIMEYVPGGSVKYLLSKFKKLHEKTIQKYVRELLEGLSFLHSQNIIHRDIKCANILVANDGTIKLSDFGASKRLGSTVKFEVLSKSLRGSPYWMAPEVVKKSGHSFAADIWSVGCVVIEMLTGSPPWSSLAKGVKEVLEIIANASVPPEYPKNISQNCKHFLDSCLQLNYERRPTAMELLDHPFIKCDILINPEESLQDFPSLEEMVQNGQVYDLNEFVNPKNEVGIRDEDWDQIVYGKDQKVYNIDDFPETQMRPENQVIKTPLAQYLRKEEELKQLEKQAIEKVKREAWQRELQQVSYSSLVQTLK